MIPFKMMYKPILQREKLVYNGGISDFWPLSYIKRRMNVVQISQGLGYKICSTTSPNFFPFGSFVLVFEIPPLYTSSFSAAMLRDHVRFVCNMSMLRHRFSNEREEGGGGGGALNHLPLLFCKSV